MLPIPSSSMDNTPKKIPDDPPIPPPSHMCISGLPSGISHESTIYYLRIGSQTSSEQFLQLLQEHPLYLDEVTFFFLQGQDNKHETHTFFRVYRHSENSIFHVEKGTCDFTSDGYHQEWSVDRYYERDDLKKIAEDLWCYHNVYCI